MTGELRRAVGELLELDVAPIVQVGDPVLRRGTQAYDGQLPDTEFDALLGLMSRTMRAAPGVGLAAPQIGIPLAVAVIEDPGADDDARAVARERPPLTHRVLVNPRYEPLDPSATGEPERAWFYEGCLSVTGLAAVVGRWRSVRLTGSDETGASLDEVLTGWPARIVQHETDHLQGVLYLDRAELRSLASGPAAAHWAGEPHPHAAALALGFTLPEPGTGVFPDRTGNGQHVG